MPVQGGDRLRKALQDRKRRLSDLTPAMRVIGEEIVKRTVESFRDRRSPAGAEWSPLAQSTLAARAAKLPGARRRGKGGGLTKGAIAVREAGMANPRAIAPLIDTGRMRASAGHYKAAARSVTWSVVKYGIFHMAGGKRAGSANRPPKRNFAVYEPDGTGGWRMIPAMLDYAQRVISNFVNGRGALP